MVILQAFILGLSAGIFCLGYCYPVLGPVLLAKEQRAFKKNALAICLFLLGRFLAYVLFGLLIGIFGSYLKDIPFFFKVVIPALFIGLGGLLILYGIIEQLPKWQLCQLFARYMQDVKLFLLLGFLTGISLCPSFLLALCYVLELGEIGKSVLFFIFFFLATSLYMLPFLFSGLISKFKNVRVVARICAIIAGCWFIYLAVEKMFFL